MASILEGTTPTLTIELNREDLLVSDIKEIELNLFQGSQNNIKHLEDCYLDEDFNSINYDFTESDTLALKPKLPFYYQLRILTTANKIVGTNKIEIEVEELASKENMI